MFHGRLISEKLIVAFNRERGIFFVALKNDMKQRVCSDIKLIFLQESFTTIF